MRNALFLCTGNSARRIIGEVLLSELGQGRYRAFSAGSHPAGRVNPAAIETLEAHRHDTRGLRSKSWNEFSGADGPTLDLVITVCDNAAGEACPAWNGSPETLHWSLPDPAAVEDSGERRAAFDNLYAVLRSRLEDLLANGDG